MSVTREELAEDYPDLLYCDGFDEALLGVAHRFGQEAVALYNRSKIIEILMRDMTRDEAEEYFEFNVIGAWVGEHTPIFAELLTVPPGRRVSAQETLKQIDSFFKESHPCAPSSPTT